jgi:hypothetical protein
METLGSLVDKLTIANCRLWALEDDRRDPKKSDADRLAAADKVSVVNSQRNALIDEIDELLHHAVQSKKAPRQPKVKLY